MTASEQRFIAAFEPLRLKTPVSCLDWAAKETQLTRRVTAEPGPFSTVTRPYQNEIFAALEDGRTSTIVLCFATQLGKTSALGIWVAYRISEDPAPILVVMPSESQARSYSETRLMPLLDSSASVRSKYPSNPDRLKLLEMHFSDCTLNLCGSNSPGEVSSRPIELLVCDEVDKFMEATGREADALSLAMERTKSFPRSKTVLASTPTTPLGSIWQQYQRGTQEEFHIQCPACGEFNFMNFQRDIRWSQDARRPNGTWDLGIVSATARWHCPACGNPMSNAEKLTAMQAGYWKASCDAPEPRVRSFHLNSLYSPHVSFGQAAVKFLGVQKNPAGLQNFISGWLAEPYEERGNGAEDSEVVSCCGIHRKGECPIEPVFVSICADPGQLQTHWTAVAWTAAGEGYVIDYGKLLSPEDLLSLAAEKQWKTPSGAFVQAAAGLIDSGDFTERIYRICAESYNPRSGKPFFHPSKGSGVRDGRELVREGGLHNHPTLRLYVYSDFHLKISLYVDRLSKKLSPRFWFPQDADNEFLRGHMGQKLITPRLSRRQEWLKVDWDHFGDADKLQIAVFVIVRQEFESETQKEEPSL